MSRRWAYFEDKTNMRAKYMAKACITCWKRFSSLFHGYPDISNMGESYIVYSQ